MWEVAIHVLTVGDNELNVGDNKDESSEAAEVGTHVRRHEEITWIGVVE